MTETVRKGGFELNMAERLPKDKKLIFWKKRGSEQLRCLILRNKRNANLQNEAKTTIEKQLQFEYSSEQTTRRYRTYSKVKLTEQYGKANRKIIDLVSCDITDLPVIVWKN